MLDATHWPPTAAASVLWPSPLDPALTVGETLGAAVGLAALLGGVGAISGRATRGHGIPVAALLWAAVWVTEGLRSAGHPLWLAVAVVCAIGAVGVRWPAVCVALTVAGGAWTPALRVIDDGVGMDAEMSERIFEPFYSARRDGSGTGLGMSIVRNAVVSLNGRVGVDSKPGRGTTVSVSFPHPSPTQRMAALAAEGSTDDARQ